MALLSQVGVNALLAGRITKTLNGKHVQLRSVQGFGSNSNYGALFEDGGLQHAKKCKKPPFFLIIAVFGSKMGYKKSNLQKTVHNWNCWGFGKI